MERLRAGELERVRRFLEETAVPCDLAGFGAVVLPAVQRLVPSAVACYAQVDPARGAVVAQETYPNPAPPEEERRTFERHMAEHPVFQQWARTGARAALRRSELLPRRQWHRRGLYQEVYKGLGCEDSMPIGLPAPEGLLGCVCIERDRDFSEREAQLLELARPHLVQLYRTAELISLLGRATQSGDVRGIALDAAGRPLVATPTAWDLLAAYFPGEAGVAGGFPRPVAVWLRGQLARFVAERELPPPAAPLMVQNGAGARLTLRLLYGGATGEQALLLLEERRAEPPVEVAPHLRLSPREVEVLFLVREGRASGEIAALLSISRRTVEKHLENIYCKLDVDNRTAAVTVAFAAVRDRSEGRIDTPRTVYTARMVG